MKSSVTKRILALVLTALMFVGFIPVAGISAYADGYAVTVTVVDETSQPVSGATVTVATVSGTTNASGVASLTEVPGGEQIITVSKEGYEYISAPGTIDASKVQTYNVGLKLKEDTWKSFFKGNTSLFYTGKQQNLVTVSENLPSGTTVTYSVSAKPEGASVDTTGIPKGDIPGDYTVHVKAEYNSATKIDDNYTCKINASNTRIIHYSDTVLESNYVSSGNTYDKHEQGWGDYLISEYAIDEFPEGGKNYGAVKDDLIKDVSALDIKYDYGRIKDASSTPPPTGEITIGTDGKVTLKDSTLPGVYYVTAEITGTTSDYYIESAKNLTNFIVLKSASDDELLSFKDHNDGDPVDYSTTGKDIPYLMAVKKYALDKGTVKYSIDGKGEILCDSETGELTLDESKMGSLFKNINNDGYVKFTVTASKTVGSLDFGTFAYETGHDPITIGSRKIYDEQSITYELHVYPSTWEAKDIAEAYTIKTGNKTESGWYAPDSDGNVLTLTAKEGYKLNEEISGTFKDTIVFKANSGDGEKNIAIQKGTKASNVVPVYEKVGDEYETVKVDATAPTATIQYSGATWLKIVEQVATLGFKKSGITVTITAEDASSGVNTIKWWFDEDAGLMTSSDLVFDDDNNTDVVAPMTENDAFTATNQSETTEFEYKFTLKVNPSFLPKLTSTYKGAIKAVITDRAGNETDEFSKLTVYTTKEPGTENEADDVIVVVDEIKPVLTINENSGVDASYIQKSDDNTVYVKGKIGDEVISSVPITFTVTEANFDVDDIKIKVDGETVTPEWTDQEAKAKTPAPGGKDDEIYYGSFKISGIGARSYEIVMEDKAGNLLSSKSGETYAGGKYTSKTIVIDNTAPVVTVSVGKEQFSNHTTGTKWYTNKDDGSYKYDIEIEEENFNSDKVTYSYKLDGVTTTKTGSLKFKLEEGKYKSTLEVSGDGDYTDFSVTCTDEAGNVGTGSFATELCIDTVNPMVNVSYEDGLTSRYYNSFTKDNPRTATVTVKDKNFNKDAYTPEEVLKFITANDIAGEDVTGTVTVGDWEKVKGVDDTYKVVVKFSGEANYVFNPEFADLATNKATTEDGDITNPEQVFTIDVTSPRANGKDAGTIGIEYNIGEANQGTQRGIDSQTGIRGFITDILTGISFGYWKDNVEITVTVYDDIAGVTGENAVVYTYTRAQTEKENDKTVYVSETNTATATGTATLKQDTIEKNKFVGVIEIPKEFASSQDGQLDGTLEVKLTDLCGNESKDDNTQKVRVVYDTISPALGVSFAPVVNTANGISYFAGDIAGTVNVTEANFFTDQLTISGKSSNVTWTSNNADSHTGTFSISGDGKHTVTINGADYAGNTVGYTSGTMVIDTEIEAPEITVNDEDCNGKSYKDEAEIGVSYFDMNFDTIDIKVTRTQMGSKNVDVTSKVIKETPEVTATGGSYFADDFEKIRSNDGIYTVTATMTDLANHSSIKQSVFSVNRFGSVYEFSDYLTELVQDDGQYVQYVEEDLKIREINPDKLVEGSTKVSMTCDGKPVDNVKFTVNPVANDKVEAGESGWYEYLYTISKDNFKEDGLYKITVTSQDAAGNKSENGKYQNMTVQFYVDSTPPELTSVTGLEKAIVNSESLDIDYAVFDTFGLKNVTVYLDDEVQSETDKFEDMNYHEGGFTIQESNKTRKIRIVAEDLAGNITDTDSEDFESAFTMNKSVTVSTNAFVRFYANKPLFYGVVGGIVFAAAAVGIAVPAVKKAKLKKKDKSDIEK